MSFTDIYVRNKYTGRIHRVGDDVHDEIWVDRDGTPLYHNMQSGDGCVGYKSMNEDKTVDNPEEYQYGFEFVPMMDGELDEPYATQYKAQKEKDKEWEKMVQDLEERTAKIKPEPVPDDL